MTFPIKLAFAGVLTLLGTEALCPACGGVPVAAARGAAQAPDTAVIRFHIEGMTCGSCATTARIAFKRLAGVFEATVSYDDALGVVRYDPRKVTPAQLAAHLNRLTGYRATAIAGGAKASRPEGK